jgi:hypothetical protein
MRKLLLLSTAFGSLIWTSQANAVVITVTDPAPLATLAMFDDIPVGSSNFTDHGIVFSGPGTVQDTSVPGNYAQPAGDKSNYMAVEGGQTETLTAPSLYGPFGGFSIYWGSIDGKGNINTLAFWDAAKEVYSITGAQLKSMGLSTGAGSWTSKLDNEFFTFKGLPDFTSVTLSTVQNAFEFDLPVAAFGPQADPPAIAPDPSAVPELTTWVMVIVGFASLGYAAFRRSLKVRSADNITT